VPLPPEGASSVTEVGRALSLILYWLGLAVVAKLEMKYVSLFVSPDAAEPVELYLTIAPT
jgi:hypothetical protein